MSAFRWLTNDPEAARILAAADRAFERARKAASALPLAAKVAALQSAREAREAAYKSAARGGA